MCCRYTHDDSDVDVDGFGLSVYDRVNKLSKHIPVHISTLLDTPQTLQLVEGGEAAVRMENLLTEYSGKTYTFDVLLCPVDMDVRVARADSLSFTSQQVRHSVL